MVNQSFLSKMNKKSEEKGTTYPFLCRLFDILISVLNRHITLFQGQIILYGGQIILFEGRIILFGGHIILFEGRIILYGGHIILFEGRIILYGGHIIFSNPSRKVINPSKLMILDVKI